MTQATRFSAEQLETLRAEYSKISAIDPCGDTYPRLIALLNTMSQEQLRQVRDARVPFLSRLAVNRIRLTQIGETIRT